MAFKAGFHGSRWAHSRRRKSTAGANGKPGAYSVFIVCVAWKGTVRGGRPSTCLFAFSTPSCPCCAPGKSLSCVPGCLHASVPCVPRRPTGLAVVAFNGRGARASTHPCFFVQYFGGKRNVCSLSPPALGASHRPRALAQDGDVECGNAPHGRAREGTTRPSLAPRDDCFFVDVSQRKFCDEVGEGGRSRK